MAVEETSAMVPSRIAGRGNCVEKSIVTMSSEILVRGLNNEMLLLSGDYILID